ncbi:MAG: thermonuclease family protein [Limnohabitans sp.]
MSSQRLWVICVLTLVPHCVIAAVLSGRVVGISDGDTVKVLDESKHVHTIRLMGIDAPEKAQPFGQRSKQSLSSLVYLQQVHVHWSKKDKYGRIVGQILNQSGADVCIEQIQRGMAWHYKQYIREQSPEDQISYAQAEELARRENLGLWRENSPTPPWLWRKQK